MPSSDFAVTQPLTKEDFIAYYKLRFDVLRKPWKQLEGSEKDETDPTSIHAFIKEGEKAIACARLHLVDLNTSQIRYMAVDPAYQGKGLGKKVVFYLEDISRINNRFTLVLHARENAVKFYESCGYRVKENSYLLFGEIQHYLMEKDLS